MSFKGVKREQKHILDKQRQLQVRQHNLSPSLMLQLTAWSLHAASMSHVVKAIAKSGNSFICGSYQYEETALACNALDVQLTDGTGGFFFFFFF